VDSAELKREYRALRRRSQYVQMIAPKNSARGQRRSRAETAALHYHGFRFIALDLLLAPAKRQLQLPRVGHHFSPCHRSQREGVVWTLTRVVIGEVFLDDTRTQCHRSQDSRVTGRVIREPEDHVRVHR
jgi:hypothetical protein